MRYIEGKKRLVGSFLGYLMLATKTKVLGEMAFCGVYMWPFWGSDEAPQWSGMVDMPIPDGYEIG